jgi:hypothetical protein
VDIVKEHFAENVAIFLAAVAGVEVDFMKVLESSGRWWKIIKALCSGNLIGPLHCFDCNECCSWLLHGSKRCFERK